MKLRKVVDKLAWLCGYAPIWSYTGMGPLLARVDEMQERVVRRLAERLDAGRGEPDPAQLEQRVVQLEQVLLLEAIQAGTPSPALDDESPWAKLCRARQAFVKHMERRT